MGIQLMTSRRFNSLWLSSYGLAIFGHEVNIGNLIVAGLRSERDAALET